MKRWRYKEGLYVVKSLHLYLPPMDEVFLQFAPLRSWPSICLAHEESGKLLVVYKISLLLSRDKFLPSFPSPIVLLAKIFASQ